MIAASTRPVRAKASASSGRGHRDDHEQPLATELLELLANGAVGVDDEEMGRRLAGQGRIGDAQGTVESASRGPRSTSGAVRGACEALARSRAAPSESRHSRLARGVLVGDEALFWLRPRVLDSAGHELLQDRGAPHRRRE